MQIVAQFDPTTEKNFNIATNLVNGGYFLVINESSDNLVFTMPNNTQMYIPAWTAVPVHFCKNSSSVVVWAVQSTLGGSNTSISQVTVIAFSPNEHLPVSQAIPLTRQANIGNAVQTMTSTNQVTNDGNPIVTTFIEATQSGNTGGSNVSMGNDGSFQYAQWISSVFTKYLYGIPGVTPAVVLGTKAILQALDNSGANISNILGIDSSGNTFIQNHKTNNQTIIYDKLGNVLLTVDANACLKISGALQTSNGDTSGNFNIYEGIYGIYKVMLGVQNNYKQAGGAFQFTLKNLFAGPAFFFNGGCGGIQLVQAGSVQSLNCFATVSATGGTHTAQTIAQQDTFGWCNTNFNQIGPSGGYATAHAGIFVVIGI